MVPLPCFLMRIIASLVFAFFSILENIVQMFNQFLLVKNLSGFENF
jgi:hypothetical protein